MPHADRKLASGPFEGLSMSGLHYLASTCAVSGSIGNRSKFHAREREGQSAPRRRELKRPPTGCLRLAFTDPYLLGGKGKPRFCYFSPGIPKSIGEVRNV